MLVADESHVRSRRIQARLSQGATSGCWSIVSKRSAGHRLPCSASLASIEVVFNPELDAPPAVDADALSAERSRLSRRFSPVVVARSRSTGHRLGLRVLHLPPFMYYPIQNCMPHLLWMLTPCEPNGVGLESPGRRSSSQAGRATCTFAERDHTGTGKRTGKTKTVKPHTHARARGRRKR